MRYSDLVVETLLRPDSAATCSDAQWDLLIRQARRANLLGRLAHTLADEQVPVQAARQHLLSARIVGERQQVAIRWEVECIRRALAPTGVPLVLLKGAAYVMAGLPVSRGRMFSDVDIIVPKQALPAVESALMMNGWFSSHHDAYDQRYYRKWSHELPPMQHMRRGTVIDVHHAIIRQTGRIKADSAAMRDSAVTVPGHSGVFVFTPIDMLLHSATHLFQEGELDNGLRDLFDIDSLLRHFGATPEFWTRLAPRASELGLERPLYYALRYAKALLGTPVPGPVSEAAARGAPRVLQRPLMDFCYSRGLRADHPTCSDRWTALARQLLYIRSHWLRMPLPLLIYHLMHKALFPPAERNDPGIAPVAYGAEPEAENRSSDHSQ